LLPPASIPPTHGMSFSVRPQPEGNLHGPAGPPVARTLSLLRRDSSRRRADIDGSVSHNNSNESHSRRCGADAPSARVPPDPPFRGLTDFSSRPTWASAADQGSAPLRVQDVFEGACATRASSTAGRSTHVW
jgi:hypothetical protein